MGDPIIQAADQIKGWMSIPELEWLYQVAQRMNDLVELGCFEGRSTYVFLEGCPGPVYAVDCHWCGSMFPFSGNEQHTYPALMRNVGHFSNLVAIESTFMEAVGSVLIPPQVDMIFIDGDHAYASVLQDLQMWGPRAKKMICGHDLCPETPGVEQALNEYFSPGQVQAGPGSLWYVDL